VGSLTLVTGRPARDHDAIRQLARAAAAADGHPALNEAVWRDLDHDADDDDDQLDVLATVSSHAAAAGYAHAGRSDNEAEPGWEAALVVAPSWRSESVDDALLDAIVAGVAARGGGPVVLWRLGAGADDDALAARADFRVDRTLLEMGVPLPLDVEPVWPDGVTVRAFEPGRDEAAWVAQNNRSFAGHPEQGGWTEETLRAREADPWFDPAGFLLAERDGTLVGSCWTKVHEHDGRGEIYVIGVDPDHAGGGLGRALVVAGLAHLAGRGLATGMLFVDAANEAAVGLYRSLGFETERADRAYERDVQSSSTPQPTGDPQ
jgi:mycothiol synthase